jgi:uncharacterized membrane protein (UPF0127 family)
MARWVTVRNRSRGGEVVQRARWCESFLCRLRGLTFRRSLPRGEGLVLVESREGRAQTAIHMWMVAFPIGVAWLDDQRVVVDTRLALPWRIYVPSRAARYTLEGGPGMLQSVAVGEVLEFDETVAG